MNPIRSMSACLIYPENDKISCMIEGNVKISNTRVTDMLGNIGHKRPFLPSVEGIGLLYVMYRQRTQTIL